MKRVLYACLVALWTASCPHLALAQLANSCWPKFHKDYLNTGQGIYGGTGSDLSWTYPTGGAIRSTTVVAPDGTAYCASDDGKLRAIGGDGVKLWEYNCNCLGTPSPAVASDGTIYCASADKYLYAINPTGTLKWKKALTAKVESSIALGTDGTIYFGSASNLIALRADGSQKWSFATGGTVYSTPAIDSNGVIYVGSMDGGVYAVYSGGTQKWKFTSTGSGGFAAGPAIGSDGTIYIGSVGGYFFAIRSTGLQGWRVSAGGEVQSTAAIASSGNIHYGCRDGKLHTLSPLGASLWTVTTGHYVDSSPAVGTDGGVYVGSLDGKLYALNPDGTQRWQYDTGSGIASSPAVGPAGCLFVGANNGILYCFAADETPPISTVVLDDGAYTSLLDRIHGSWSGVDPESGIFSYEYCIGTAPGLDDVAPWLNVGSATQHTRTGLSLVDRQTYYITVKAINGAGLRGAAASSDGIIADATAPSAPVVTDGGRFTSSGSSLSASWTATDPESGVAGYQYAIGTTPGGTNLVGWTDAGANTQITRTGLSLVSGTTYYFSVKALNGGGIYGPVGSSDGITVDTSSPATPTVMDSGLYFSNPTTIHASWSSSDPESGISRFEYSVGTSAGNSSVRGWTDAGTSVQMDITGLDLSNGSTYYVNCRATNGAGLISSVGSSDGITLDTTPPVTPTVTDDGAYTASTSQLHATWSSSDPQSGIASYKYAVGTTAGAANVVPWTDVGTNTSVTKTGLSLTDKQAYYFSVIATNGAGAASEAGVSNGIIVDATPPTKPVVTDDGAYTGDSSQIHASWVVSDSESGIARSEYSIGTSAGATDVVGWTDADGSTSVTRTGLNLLDGKTYYVNVRAYNTVNVVSEIGSSDGITVDLVTPQAPVVTDDGLFTSSSSALHASWTAVASPSGVARYEYSVGTSPGGTNIRTWTTAGTALQVNATGLALQNGVVYFINVRAVNTLGKVGYVGSSDGITVDTTPPTTPVVTDAGAWSASPTTINASWSSTDPESGVVEYKYAVGTTPGATNVLNWTSAGSQTTLDIGPLALSDLGTYYVSVKARNAAGAESAVGTSDGIRLDLTPPTTPTVTDDGYYTVDATRLHALWMASDTQSGIARYEYSIGTTAGAADVIGWNSAGTATEYTINGLSLQSGTRYYINVRAINGAGSYSAIGSSDGIIVETTPPTTPVVTDDGAFTSSTTTIHACWTTQDPETGVIGCQYSIGTTLGGHEIVPWTSVGTATCINRTDLTLVAGQTYYVNVTATNGIGLISAVGSSDGITVDLTPPDVPTVHGLAPFSSETDRLRVTVASQDAESGIASYECAVGTTPGATDVKTWANCGPGPDVVVPGLELTNAKTYYVTARAINGAGITGQPGVSEGITVDATPPSDVRVIDDGAYTGDATSLHGRWSASDPESGIAGYKYCIGTAPGLNDVADWLDVGAASSDTRGSLALVSGQTYYITVIARNAAGAESAPASSDGICLDLTPPSVPTVQDTGTYWGYRTSIYATWNATDPESGIAEYQMSVGTAAGQTDVAGWLSVGTATSFTRTGLNLRDGITYYVNVRARNGAGTWGEAGSSDGVLIDSTPPTPPVVTDDGDYTALLDSLHASWSSGDPESGIAEYTYCIGTSPGATDVRPWVSAGTNLEATVTGLSLEPLLKYYFSVKARSNSGAWSAVGSSDGIAFATGPAIWGKFRNDLCNRGVGLFGATTVSDLAWKVQTEGYVEASPAIAADGATYIGSADGNLYSITQNGKLRWRFAAGGPIESSPAIAANRNIVFGCEDGKVYCVSQLGEAVWTFNTGGAVRSSPTVTESTAYVGSSDHKFYAIDVQTGSCNWTYTTGGAVTSSPAIDANHTIYFGSQDNYLYALNPDGTRKWRFLTGSAVDASPAVGADGTIYVGSGDGYLYAINPNGTQKWRFLTGTLADSSVAIGPDGNIYFGAGFDGGNGKLFALRPDKSVIWQTSITGGGIVSSPSIDPNGNIYVGSCDGNVYAYAPNGTRLWAYKTQSSVISSPALGGDSSVVFGSYDGGVYCLRDVTSKDLTPPTTPVVNVPGAEIPVGCDLVANWSATDPESMVAEYTYAVGTGPTPADNANVISWTSTGIETSVSVNAGLLQVGNTYYVSVKARNPSQRWSDVGTSQGVTITSGGIVGRAGDIQGVGDGFHASLHSKVVTAVFPDCFFVEEPNRCAGVRCNRSNATLRPGDRIDVAGTVRTVDGRKLIDDAEYQSQEPGPKLGPLGVVGQALQGQSSKVIGLYVTCCGRVTAVGSNYVVLDDGAGLSSARGVHGLEIRVAPGFAKTGDYCAATGVLWSELLEGHIVPVLRPMDGGFRVLKAK